MWRGRRKCLRIRVSSDYPNLAGSYIFTMNKRHALRHIHSGIKSRCTNPKREDFRHYGGRGIKICDRWLDFAAFAAEVEAEIGPRPSMKHTIDRKNGDGDYCPGNIRWATQTEQLRNQRRNRMITAGGRTLCLSEWAEISGIDSCAILARIDRLGWSEEDAVSIPKNRRSIGSVPTRHQQVATHCVTRSFGISIQITEDENSPLLTAAGLEKALRAMLVGKSETDDGKLIIPPLRFEIAVNESPLILGMAALLCRAYSLAIDNAPEPAK